jgi:very-short-patch-repair endonuclease
VAINQHRNPHPNPSPLGEGLSTVTVQPTTQIEKTAVKLRRKLLLPGEKAGDEGSQTLKFARQLRRSQTDAEKLLWSKLRDRALNGYKFRRQVPVGHYIADFLCQEVMLIVELDGGQHAEQQGYDQRRTRWLESQEFNVMRFWNSDVLLNIDGICDAILEAVSKQANEIKI